MAKKDLYICDFCGGTRAVEVDHSGFALYDVPPGWGRLSLNMRADEPHFERTSHSFDLSGGEGSFERRIRVERPFRMDGIEVVMADGPTGGWNLLRLMAGVQTVVNVPTPLVEFTEHSKGDVQDAFPVTAVMPGMDITAVFSFDGCQGMLGREVSSPQVSVVGENLLSVGYDEEQRNTGESVLCGACCGKLALRIDEREVPLKMDSSRPPLGVDPMDCYGDLGEVRGFPVQPFRMEPRPMIRQAPMARPVRRGIPARRIW